MTDEFRLIQVSDPHLSASRAYYLDNWALTAEWIAREKPDLVAVTGDMVLADPDSEEDHRFARAQIDCLPVPCRCIPGNHDVGDNIISGRMPKRVTPERCRRFTDIYGHDRWVQRAAGWTLIGLNAQILGSDGMGAESEQWRWLEAELAGSGSDTVALFLHKPLYLDHPSEADHEDAFLRQSCIDSTSRQRLLDLAHQHGVRLISAGHKHQSRAFAHDGIYYIWAPATACVNGRPDAPSWGAREVGFLDFRFRAGAFRHRFIGGDFLFRHENYIRKMEYGSSMQAPEHPAGQTISGSHGMD